MKGRRIIKVVLGILVALLILALAIAPVIVKKQAVKRSQELIGRQISLDKLKVNYFSSTVRVIDFKLYEADDEEVFVSFDTLLVNLAPLKLIRKNLVIKQFYLKGLTSHILLQDSIFNFTDLLEHHQSEEPDTTTGEPFQYIFSNLEMKDAYISFTDASIDKTIYVRDLSFFIPYIAWNQEDKSEAGIKFNFHQEGYLQASLNVDPTEGEFDGQISINRLYLHEFTDFLKKAVPLDSIGGLVNTNLSFTGDLDELEHSIVSGDFELLNFEISDQIYGKLLGLERMNFSINDIDPQKQNYLFDSLILTQPYVHFELYDSSNNFFDFLGIQAVSEEDSLAKRDSTLDVSSSEDASPVFFALNSFIIEDGIIDYTDHRTSEAFNYHLSEMAMTADSISNQEDWINLYSRMLLNNRGKLNADLGINPQDPMNMELDIVISDFILSDLNIYSRYYLGSSILRGDMYYKSNTIISGGQLSSENKLIIENVEVGDEKGGLHDLPLRFAVFLLKDRQGVIDLDVPVGGDLKDPEVNVGKIVWNTFKNLIVKTVAAPFDLLADLMGVDPDDIKAIEFAYGDTTLTDQRKEQLDLLLSLEAKKEGLGMELIYYNDADKERDQVFLAESAKKQSSIPEADSIELAQSCAELVELYKHTRIRLVNDYLKSVNDSSRIFTSESHADASGNVGSIPRLEVEYTMSEYREED